MFNFKKIRFGIHFSGVIVIFLSISMIIIAIVALISLRNLGIYTISKLEGSLAVHSTELLLEETQRKAEDYSNIFRKVSDLVSVLSGQTVSNINSINNYNFNKSKIQEYCTQFKKNTDKGNLVNTTVRDTLTVFAGKEKTIPEELNKKLYSLSLLNSLLKKVYFTNPNYYSSWIWFSDDNIFTVYSQNNEYRSILSQDDGYKNFLSQIKTRIGNKGEDKVKLTRDYKNIVGESVISAVYEYYNDNGQLIFMAGIELELDASIKDIINKDVFIRERDNDNETGDFSSFTFIVSSADRRVILSVLGENKLKQFSFSKLLDGQPSHAKPYNPILSELRRNIYKNLKGQKGFFSFSLNSENYLLTYSKISANDWYLGVAVLKKDFLSKIIQPKNRISNGFTTFEINFFLLFSFFLLLSILVLIIFFRKYIIRPISKFRNDVFKMGRGNFDLTIRHHGVSEITDLAESFNTLGHKVHEYIKELKIETADRNRREKEMKIAKRIQQAVLPRITSAFRGNRIRLFARLHPANNVAGDFYDFFFLSKKRVALLVADVSGKGVSAAFYMTIAKSTIRNACINEPDDPAKALCLSNELLCEYNLKMFVSVFLVYYDLGTELFQYGNAGHNEPVILRRDGENKFFGTHHDMVLGIFPDLKFHKGQETFGIGDAVVLYTDGITEANASNDDYFGEERLIKYLAEKKTLSAENLCRSLIAHVHQFEKGNQYDDMTVLTIKRKS